MSFVIVFTAPPLQLTLLPQAVNCFCSSHLLLLRTLFCTHEICMHITTIYVLGVLAVLNAAERAEWNVPKR